MSGHTAKEHCKVEANGAHASKHSYSKRLAIKWLLEPCISHIMSCDTATLHPKNGASNMMLICSLTCEA